MALGQNVTEHITDKRIYYIRKEQDNFYTCIYFKNKNGKTFGRIFTLGLDINCEFYGNYRTGATKVIPAPPTETGDYEDGKYNTRCGGYLTEADVRAAIAKMEAK